MGRSFSSFCIRWTIASGIADGERKSHLSYPDRLARARLARPVRSEVSRSSLECKRIEEPMEKRCAALEGRMFLCVEIGKNVGRYSFATDYAWHRQRDVLKSLDVRGDDRNRQHHLFVLAYRADDARK